MIVFQCDGCGTLTEPVDEDTAICGTFSFEAWNLPAGWQQSLEDSAVTGR